MSKKLLVVALTVVLAAAMIGGATMAWFTDSASSNSVEFAAGTVLIEAGSSSISSQYFDPSDGVFVYGVVGNGDLYEIDVQNHTENKIFDNPNSYSGYYPNALAFDDPKDRLYFAASRTQLWYYDFSSNQLVNAGSFQHTGNKDVYSATFGGGYYWYVPNGTKSLYKVAFDSNGMIASSSSVEMPAASNLSFGDIEIDYANGIIYGSSTSFYFTYDIANNIFTNHGSAGKDLQLAWGHDGVLYGHHSGGSNALKWYSVQPSNGAKTLLFTGERSYNDLATGYKSYWNPGDCAWAKFNVKNVGTKKSHVRVNLNGYWTEYNDNTQEWQPWSLNPAEFPGCATDVVTFEIGNGLWEEVSINGEKHFYYKQVLEPNETAELSMKLCLKGPETCNEYQGKRFVMTGSFDAIQASHGASQEVWSWSPSN